MAAATAKASAPRAIEVAMRAGISKAKTLAFLED